MKTFVKISIGLVFIIFFLAACSSSPTANPATATAAPAQLSTSTATSVPQATSTTGSYPAPGDTPPVAENTPAGYPAPGGDTPIPQNAYPAPGGLILITADGNQAAIDPAVINSVAQKDVNIDGQQMQLRSLTDLLDLVGVTSYNQVTAESGGAPLVLSKDQVSQAYLDVQSDGTIRLVVGGLPQDQWLTKLTTLRIN